MSWGIQAQDTGERTERWAARVSPRTWGLLGASDQLGCGRAGIPTVCALCTEPAMAAGGKRGQGTGGRPPGPSRDTEAFTRGSKDKRTEAKVGSVASRPLQQQGGLFGLGDIRVPVTGSSHSLAMGSEGESEGQASRAPGQRTLGLNNVSLWPGFWKGGLFCSGQTTSKPGFMKEQRSRLGRLILGCAGPSPGPGPHQPPLCPDAGGGCQHTGAGCV